MCHPSSFFSRLFSCVFYRSMTLISYRTEYVQLYMDLIMNTAIFQSFKAFYLGFHSVCASNALIVSIFFSSDSFSDD